MYLDATLDSIAMTQQTKTRGVADIVFLIDATGSMAPCIDALKENIQLFIDTLSEGDANSGSPVKDWRARVVGYRDIRSDGADWLVDNPFERDAGALKDQLARLTAGGGADEPESLLDALYRVANVGSIERGAQDEDPNRWRNRSDAARVVIVFTDASYHETMEIPEAQGGSVDDVINTLVSNRIILSLFAPEMPGYDRLSSADRAEWEVVDEDGLSPQEALAKFTSDRENFRNTLKQLAASVSKSAEALPL